MRTPNYAAIASLTALANLLPSQSISAPETVEPLIRINQIGYLPEGNKVAVIADPIEGADAAESFTPGATYQVRRWSDDSVVFEAAPSVWNSGATDALSGDRGWWFDFSSVQDPGEYYLYDVQNDVRSHPFAIQANVYQNIMKAAVRMFFYQRLGFDKTAQHAGEDWADGPAFVGPGQDTEARNVYDRQNPDTERDLSGGWMDAGDYNKYVTFTVTPIHHLLSAYERYPEVFGDDYNLPESGNGIPDLIDEVHFEMQWLSRMQEPDGSVILKIGDIDHNSATPPSSDTRPRFYVPPCSSANIAAAGMYAHAALVFQDIPSLAEYSVQLEQQAIAAWDAYHAAEKRDDCDEQIVKAGDADWSLKRQNAYSAVAAMYLHRLTDESEYGAYVQTEMDRVLALPGNDAADPVPFQWNGWYVIYHSDLMLGLLSYIHSGYASESLAAEIKARFLNLENSNEGEFDWDPAANLYRSFMRDSRYGWGSNSLKSRLGIGVTAFDAYGYGEADLAERQLQAENLLHYFLGVNPFGLVYLTNMGDYGAENSVMQVYHSWFAHGSQWDTNPAPGILTGGPNRTYAPDAQNGSWDEINSSVRDAPPQKSYAEFNEGWPWNSWQITEPAIYYQAAFIRFLAAFLDSAAPPIDDTDDDGDGISNSFEAFFGFTQGAYDSWHERAQVHLREGSYQLHLRYQPTAARSQLQIHISQDLQNWTSYALTGLSQFPVEAGESLLDVIGLPVSQVDSPVYVRLQLSNEAPGPVLTNEKTGGSSALLDT